MEFREMLRLTLTWLAHWVHASASLLAQGMGRQNEQGVD